MNGIGLREYQIEALDAIAAARARNVQRSLVCLATGLGKTVVMAYLPEKLGTKQQQTMVILCHRDELIVQTVEKLRRVDPTLNVRVEQAERYASPNADVVVASVMTLQGSRLTNFHNRFVRRTTLIAIDEAHHAVSPTYKAIIEAFPTAYVVGVTATPNRSDDIGLGNVFNDIVINRDLKWGIDNGWLVPMRSAVARSLHTSLSDVRTTGGPQGDFSDGALARAIDTPDRNALIVGAYKAPHVGKRAIVYCATVRHAESVCASFEQAGISARVISAKTHTRDRRKIVDDFRNGTISVLTNVGVLTEGFDVPDVETIINARPTKSSALYTQCSGRGVRPLESIAHRLSQLANAEQRKALIARSGKPYTTIIDIVDGDRPRTGIQTLASLWGLPAVFNTRGRNIQELVDLFEDARSKDPEGAAKATSLEELQVVLKEYDTFSIPPLDPTVAKNSNYTWFPITNGAFRLRLPEAYVTRGVTEETLAATRQRVTRLVQEEIAKKTPDPIAAVAAREGADIFTISEWFEIAPNQLKQWESWNFQTIYRKSEKLNRSKQLFLSHSAEVAFQSMDRWLLANRGDMLMIVDQNAEWRNAEISPRQKALLQRVYNVPAARMPKTKGEANAMITRFKNSGAVERKPSPYGQPLTEAQQEFLRRNGITDVHSRGEFNRRMAQIKRGTEQLPLPASVGAEQE